MSSLPTSHSNDFVARPDTSPNDKKSYRFITLDNGLRVLLVSDIPVSDELPSALHDLHNMSIDTDMDKDGNSRKKLKLCCNNKKTSFKKQAAVCLVIEVGSYSDPEEFPGLAHFLEHMIFMGTEKYPEENHFDVYLKRYGGSSNASTGYEYTTFYFDIQLSGLKDGLDNFAQCFINPKLNISSMEKEVKNLHSEFETAKSSDSARLEQLYSVMANEGHPVGKFIWGSQESLQFGSVPHEELNSNLRKFYDKYYAAQLMRMCIQGQAPLDTLAEWATETFKDLHFNDNTPPDFIQLGCPYLQKKFHKMYHVLPIKNKHQLDITWSLDPAEMHYQSSPLQYLTHIISHEGKGSLASYLKKNMWISDLTCDYNDTHVQSVLYISLQLFDKGFECMEEVLNATFSYLALLKESGPQEFIFKELQQISNISFQFSEEIDPVENVEILAQAMFKYPNAHVITGDILYFQYNPQLITAYLSALVPNSANIVVKSPNYKDTCSSNEKWFGTKYQCKDIPEDWSEKWMHIKPYPEFNLPEENPFIASDFTLYNHEKNNSELKDIDVDYPTKINLNGCDIGLELWYKLNNTFKVPKAYLWFQLQSVYPLQCPQSYTLMCLWVRLIKFKLMAETYLATMAGLSYSISPCRRGVNVRISGYNHKLPIFLQLVVNYFTSIHKWTTEELFETIKTDHKKKLSNHVLNPENLSEDLLFKVMNQVQWSTLEMYQCIDSLRYNDMLQFSSVMCSQIKVPFLIEGNITANQAVEAVQTVISSLQCNPVATSILDQLRVFQLPVGISTLQVESFNPDSKNTVCTHYYQTVSHTLKSSCLHQIIVYLLEEPIFNKLRTEEQLGYDVSVYNQYVDYMQGFALKVCSSKFDASYLQQKMEAFLVWFWNEHLSTMTVERLQEIVLPLIDLKRCMDVQLEEEVGRYWPEIEHKKYLFNRRNQEILCLQKITLDEIQKFYHEYLHPHKHTARTLIIQVIRMNSTEEDNNLNATDNMEDGDSCSGSDDYSEDESGDVNIPTDFNLKFLPDAQLASITDITAFQNRQTLCATDI